MGSIMTRNMAGTDLWNFFTNSNPTNGITLMELIRGSGSNPVLGRPTTPGGGMTAGGNWEALWANTRTNAVPLIMGMIGTPIVFRFGKKFARPVLTPIRGLLKGSGVTV